MALTQKRTEKLKHRPGRHFDRDGLYLQVPEPGKAQPRALRGSWLLRYEIGGQEKWMGIGKLADVNLAEAREEARKLRQSLRRDGIDPLEQRRANRAAAALEAAKAITFEVAAESYFDQHSPGWKNAKHTAQFMSTMKAYVFPKIGRLSVSAIDTGLVLKCIEPIWSDRTETANRTRGRIESVLDWATVRGYRKGDNPARWKGHLAEVLPKRSKIAPHKHHTALPYADLPSLMADLRRREGIAADALEFLILTAARTGEVIGATWSEFDTKNKVWTVPANRIKAGKEHKVPLSDRALEILKALPHEKGNAHVFVGPRKGNLSNMALDAVLRRMGYKDGRATVHGFRSTFRTWASECTAYPHDVCEAALAHTISDAVVRAYKRTDFFDKRRALMRDWAKYCVSKPIAATGTVVPIRGAAS